MSKETLILIAMALAFALASNMDYIDAEVAHGCQQAPDTGARADV